MKKNRAVYMGRSIKVCGSVERDGRKEKERGKRAIAVQLSL